MNIKKIIAGVTAVAMVATQAMTSIATVSAASVNPEWTTAVNFMKTEGLSSVANSVEEYNPLATVKREAAAKFFTAFAEKEFAKTADTTLACDFSDKGEANPVFVPYMKKACQMGIIKGANGKFMPKATLTKLQFLTILARIVKNDSNLEPATAFAALKADGITKAADIAATVRPVSRIELAILFQRAVAQYSTDDGDDGSDIGDVIGDIIGGGDDTTGGDTTPTTTGDDTTTGGDTTPTTTTASITLNPATPASADVPTSVSGVEVLKFDITAGSKDLTVNAVSLKRNGLSSSTSVKSVVLFADNERISKAKNFNSTTDLAEVNVTPVLVVKAGTTVSVVAKVATDATAGKFTVSVDSVNASETLDASGIVSNQFETIVTAKTTLTIEKDGTVVNPKLGQKQAELLKFKVKNDGTANEDVEIASITFKDADSNIDTDAKNITLYHNGEALAVVPSVSGKYVTFNFATPFVVKEDKTEKFVIKADIDAGASDTIDLYIDNVLDVTVKAPKKVYAAVALNANLEALPAVTIQAGQVTIIDTDPANTDVLDNKKNVVFGTFEVKATSGKDLYVDSIKYTLTDSANNLNTALENVELYDATNGVSYDPTTPAGAALSEKYSFTDLDLAIKDGASIKFELRADIKDGANVGDKIAGTIDVANDVVIKEATDDKVVTDKIPSNISFKNVEVVAAALKITALVQSDTSVVAGAKGVETFKFEIKSDNDASDLDVKELKIGLVADPDAAPANTAGNVINNTRLNALYLYDGDTLLASKSASDITTRTSGGSSIGVITFDSLNIKVAKNTGRTLTLKVDVLDDVNNAGDKIKSGLVGYSVEDSESDDVYLAADADKDGDLLDDVASVISKRKVAITGVGTLAVVVDNTDDETKTAKNILAGTTSPFVASYEFTAINEGVKVIDFKLDQTNGAVDLEDAVAEVVLYANDKTTEIARETVSSNEVKFNNVNYVLPEGSSNVYVKVVTHKIGKDEAGSQVNDLELKLTITDAEGDESGKTIVMPAQTAASKAFSVVPVRVSTVAFVNEYNGTKVADTLAHDTDQIVAILAITTDSSVNTDSVDGGELKTVLKFVNVEKQGVALKGVKITRINGGDTDGQAISTTDLAAGTVEDHFDMTALTSDDNNVDNGSTVYYKIEGKPQLTATDGESLKISVVNLDDAAANKGLDYSSDAAGAADIKAMNLGTDRIDGTTVSE